MEKSTLDTMTSVSSVTQSIFGNCERVLIMFVKHVAKRYFMFSTTKMVLKRLISIQLVIVFPKNGKKRELKDFMQDSKRINQK